jgi:transposase
MLRHIGLMRGLMRGGGCLQVEGGVTDEVFYEWAECQLFRHVRNKIVIADNAVIHHQPRFIRLMERAGATLFFLSPYSPDFSAIELRFKPMKDYLRRVRHACVSHPQQTFFAALRHCNRTTSAHAQFRACGYPVLEAGDEDLDEEVAAALVVVCAAAAL